MSRPASQSTSPRLAFAAILVLSSPGLSWSQSGDSRGRDFLLAYMPNYSNSGMTVELHLTSETATSVTVEYPARLPSFRVTVDVFPGLITEVVLPNPAASGWVPDLVMDNAVHAFADEEFVAYMINRISTTSDAALGVPVTGMGTEYLLAGHPGSMHGWGEFTVVASQDGTTVTITPSVPLGFHAARVPYEVRLDRGQGYLAQASVPGIDDVSGTLVVADAPVGITNGHSCLNVPAGVLYCDHVFEVAQPTATWGEAFITFTVPDRPGGTVFRVVGSVDGTTLELDGLDVGLVDRGQVVDLGMLRDAHLLTASRPVFVVQFITGQGSVGATTGDPAMGNVVPLEQFLSSYTFSTVGSGHFSEHHALITAETADVGSVLLDDTPVDPAGFAPVAGTTWSVATVRLSEGAHRTSSPGPHGVQVVGYTAADSYLFPGGTQLVDLDCRTDVVVPLTDATICAGEEAVLDGSGISLRDCAGAVTHEWREVGGAIVGTDPVLAVSPSETTDYELTITCTADPDCTFTDSATVVVHVLPVFDPPASQDFSACSLGLRLDWSPATFQSPAGGVYNVYRSEGPTASCADALSRPPVAVGLTGLFFIDRDTVEGQSYVHVVEAEDALAPTACPPGGPVFGGAVTRQCLSPLVETGAEPLPDGVGIVLFASHVGHEVSLRWDGARALQVGERFRLRKSAPSAIGPFETVTDADGATRLHVETDPSRPLQYFELRVANRCEELSLDEFPAER